MTFMRPALAPLTLLVAATPAIPAALPQQRLALDFSRFAPTNPGARTIPAEIDDHDRVVLHRNIPGAILTKPAEGFADPAMPMKRMILSLKMSPDAQSRLNQLSAAQQDPNSPYFHQWLTPEKFGALFGPSRADMDAVAAWLMAQGFSIDEISNGRLSITFSGTVAQVQQSFRTSIKTFMVDGTLRHANASNPTLPADLAGVVDGVVSLTDIPRKTMNSGFRPLPAADAIRFASPKGVHSDYTSSSTSAHYMAPADFATIYNLNPLYTANIDGTGVTIAIVGRSNFTMSDVTNFRSQMGLPANNPTVILNGTDPGIYDSGELGEALLDVEWSGAVAKKATIKFVATKSTASTDGVDLSAQYIVDHNTATVMSTSFGQCEASLGAAGNTFYYNLWQQAAAEGITAFVSAGDSGAAGCDAGNATSGTGAAISGLASTPFNVCVGGTEFNEGGTPNTYWSATNNAGMSSALSYIPEVAWNESFGATAADGTIGSGLWSTGGGVSTVYAKPSWQATPGVPADAKRDCPDVSLAAAGYDGYLIIQGGKLATVGGTSASSPSFAGLMALIVQKTGGTGQGNANPRFYQLGSAQYGGNGTLIFHDTTIGNNTVPGVAGFAAGTGYDLATGLGSVDGEALVNHWDDPVVVVLPGKISLNVGGTTKLVATATRLSSNIVTWTASAGSFSSTTTPGDGTTTTIYTAPTIINGAQQTFTITATGSDGRTSGRTTVTVTDPAAVTLSINPNTTQIIRPGATIIFSAIANVGDIQWNTTAGSLDKNQTGSNDQVLFQAPPTPGDVTVTVTSLANPALSRSVLIHVRDLTINPSNPQDIATGDTISFTATTSNLLPNTVTWNSGGLGSFTPSTTPGDGTTKTIWTAPATVASAGSSPISIQGLGSDGTTGYSVGVRVVDPAAVILRAAIDSNAPKVIFPNTWVDIFATTNWGYIIWSTTGGKLLYNSSLQTLLTPATVGDVTVTATSSIKGGPSQSLVVHVRSLDQNNDGTVDVRDLLVLAGAYSGTAPATNQNADLNGDGRVDDADLTLFLANF